MHPLPLFVRFTTLGLTLALAACRSPSPLPGPPSPMPQATAETPSTVLIEGDELHLAFAAAPDLNGKHTIRRDGRLALPLVGEIYAAGLTPMELEETLSRAYADELVSNEINVTVVASSFPIFVTGAVLRPGKIVSARSLTALEAVMEAGGFAGAKANSRKVVVVRQEEGRTRNYTIDLHAVLTGRDTQPFQLQPSDIIFVPERFTWF